MKKIILIYITVLSLLIFSCTEKKNPELSTQKEVIEKTIDSNLPTIGVLIFEGFLTNEVVAPIDVFTKQNSDGKFLFNVVVIAKENKTYISEEGLKVLPDFTITKSPKLSVLVVPSSFHPERQVADKKIVNFIKEQNKTTDYIASHCAGAFLLGEAGIADGKEIVTYVTGGESLKKEYPNLKVMDDSKVSVVEDGKIISSNGSLVSYIASLNLLERMTTLSHRKYVEEQLLLDRLVSKK